MTVPCAADFNAFGTNSRAINAFSLCKVKEALILNSLAGLNPNLG
jgi:hypothetical protein